jgi:hypothetical protein
MTKWMKGDQFLEVATGIAVEPQRNVCYVESSERKPWGNDMPIEFRPLVDINDQSAIELMQKAVESYATRQGFTRA